MTKAKSRLASEISLQVFPIASAIDYEFSVEIPIPEQGAFGDMLVQRSKCVSTMFVSLTAMVIEKTAGNADL